MKNISEKEAWDEEFPPGKQRKDVSKRSHHRGLLKDMYDTWKPKQEISDSEINFQIAEEEFKKTFGVEPTAVNVNNIMRNLNNKVEEGNDIFEIIEDDEYLDSILKESSKQTGGSSGSYKFLIDEYQKDMEYFKNKKGGKKTKRRKIKNKVTKKNI